MNSLLILVPVSIVLFGIAIGLLVWAVRRGQFDDLDTPALDILAEDNPSSSRQSGSATNSSDRSQHAD